MFRIANSGPGISKEHEIRVFERFYRADPSRSSEISGSGLGLSICREIVAAHGGQMWLEQVRPGLTAFTVTLSAQNSESQAVKKEVKNSTINRVGVASGEAENRFTEGEKEDHLNRRLQR